MQPQTHMKSHYKKIFTISVAALAIVVAGLLIIAFSSYSERNQTVQTLNHFRQLQIARQILELDSTTSGRSSNVNSITALIQRHYLTQTDLDRLTEGYEVEFLPINNDEAAKDAPAINGIGTDQKVTVTRSGSVRIEKL